MYALSISGMKINFPTYLSLKNTFTFGGWNVLTVAGEFMTSFIAPQIQSLSKLA